MAYCASIAAIKYLHEYIYKGFDPGDAVMRDNANNEIVEFVESRFICTSDGVWRLLGIDMYEQYPPFMPLPIHLENQQYVRCSDQRTIPEVNPEGPPDTPLTAWFKSNTKPEQQFGKHLLYSDYAKPFMYHAQSKEWKFCSREVDIVVGHVYFFMPNAGELFFLCLLLNHVPCATFFAYLGFVEGTGYATYQQSRIHRGPCMLNGGCELI